VQEAPLPSSASLKGIPSDHPPFEGHSDRPEIERVVEPVGVQVSSGAAKREQPANSIPVGGDDLWLKKGQARAPSDRSLAALQPYGSEVEEDSNPASVALDASGLSGKRVSWGNDDPLDPERLLKDPFGKAINMV
jgi:hypothetical protein